MEYLLRKSTLSYYDIQACKERLEYLIEEYIRVKYAFENIHNLGVDYYTTGITNELSLVPSGNNIKYNDRVSDKVTFKIDNESEALKFNQDFSNLMKKLTDQEIDYLKLVLLGKRPQRIVEDKYRITKTALEPIKQSCIVKACMHFDIEVLK